MTKVDPITVEVIRSRLLAMVEEMGWIVTRMAHSEVFAECEDFGLGTFDADGQLVALASFIPQHVGGLKTTVDAVLREIGKDNLHEGDVVITNDPYVGGLHAQDVSLVAPTFWKGELVALSGTVAHRTDTGGYAAGGYNHQVTEIIQEALRLPCLKLVDRGEVVRDVKKVLMSNVRLAYDQWCDTEAQLAALRWCDGMIKKIIEQYGLDTFKAAEAEILNISEQRTREAIRQIPNGVYEWEAFTEDDGWTDRDWKIHAKLTIENGDMTVDFTGSDPQTNGCNNCAPYQYIAQAYTASMYMVDPSIHRCQGMFRVWKDMIAPEGTVVRPRFPAACGSATCDAGGCVFDAIMGAYTQALPERGCGCWTHAAMIMILSGKDEIRDQQEFILLPLEVLGTGGGARRNQDGWLATHLPSNHAKFPSMEIIEQRYPVRYVERELVTDGGGDGKYRGGPGVRTVWEALCDMHIQTCYLRRRNPPEGVFGGKAGEGAYISTTHEGVEHVLRQKTRAAVKKGDLVTLRPPGGGGYGDPKERDPELVCRDLKDGLISERKAQTVYGVSRSECDEG